MPEIRRRIKRLTMHLFLRGYLPSFVVVFTFRLFKLRIL
jgi:hypothetical protein